MRRIISWNSYLLAVCVFVFFPRVSPAADTDPGTHIFYYTAECDGSRQPYSVYVPTSYASFGKHPVVIQLHGFGGRFRTSWSSSLTSRADTRGWLLVSVDGRWEVGYDHVGELDVLRALGEVEAKYSVDEDRVYIYGVSMGGHGTYRLAVRFPDIFAAAAPVAGWTFYEEFVPHWYERCVEPMIPEYVDPSRKPSYEIASSLYMAENAMYTWFRIAYGTNDTTNPPENAEKFIDALDSFGYERYTEVRVEGGGHGAGGSETEIFDFFDGKTREVSPAVITYTTNRLRYGGAWWMHVTRLHYTNAWARFYGEVDTGTNTVNVTTENCARIALDFTKCPVNLGRTVSVFIDGYDAFTGGLSATEVEFSAEYDGNRRLSGWKLADTYSGLHKRAECEGPGTMVYLAPFVVVYGTHGDSLKNSENLHDAYQFTAQWNAMMICHWSGSIPYDDATSWYFPPYPAYLTAASYMYAEDAIEPVTDDLALSMDLSGKNIILYGGPESNSLSASLAGVLPPEIALSESGITVRDRSYFGDEYHYSVVYPKQDGGDGLVLFNRGYSTSMPGMAAWGANQVGKDFEGIPWMLPDYAVWDESLLFTPHVSLSSTQFKDLTGQYVESGYFDQDWRLDATPPSTAGIYDRTKRELRLEAADNDGGGGIFKTEFRIDGGAWRDYAGPTVIPLGKSTVVEARSLDDSMQYLYDDYGSGYWYSDRAARNVELARTFLFDEYAFPVSGPLAEVKAPAGLVYGDVTGDVVNGVKVVLSGPVNLVAFTNSAGFFEFSFQADAAAIYTVSAYAEGCRVHPACHEIKITGEPVYVGFTTVSITGSGPEPEGIDWGSDSRPMCSAGESFDNGGGKAALLVLFFLAVLSAARKRGKPRASSGFPLSRRVRIRL